ncbi:MAG: hypothetical protein ABSF72_16575 [Candidatus Sulfotelmatobacter sp.]|jgi:hypothetical protein
MNKQCVAGAPLVEGNSISIRIHQTLSVTPAMEAEIADYVWSFEELIALLDMQRALTA